MNKELVHVPQSGIEIFTNPDNTIQLEVKLEQETVWLTQKQMAILFNVKTPAINKHLKHIFEDNELQETEVVSKMEITTRHGAIVGKTQRIETNFYNLDAILSVGYRVNSRNAVSFRKWATKILKDYLIKGYAVRTNLQLQHYNDLKEVVALMSRTMELQENPSKDEFDGLFNVISDYVYALDTLDHYDYQQLTISKTTKQEPFHATYENAMEAIMRLKEKFGGSALFANEKDDSFKSSIGQIYQTFDGQELYPSVEEKAAMLLYLVTKNHSFSDGNKRIAAMLFLWFLSNNGILYTTEGRKRIGDNTLVALTLMIAESRTEEKDIMVKVVVNLINQENQ
ncbi:MAG: virulence RhuM family protein [Paludibacteraceae bacterium]|nr:virulence RhuM family protein [Paludibacteraceae bacterium]